MKTRHIFLIISILMIIIESILGYLVFDLVVDIGTQIALIVMMLVGVAVSIIMYAMYRDDKQLEYETYKGNL